MRRTTPEGYVLDAVLQYLAAKRIFAMRMNSGAIRLESQNGRTRYFKGHEPGTADVLAIKNFGYEGHQPYWIECKSDKGVQSLKQKEFEARVMAHGHNYILARGIEDLEEAGL